MFEPSSYGTVKSPQNEHYKSTRCIVMNKILSKGLTKEEMERLDRLDLLHSNK